ncbi:GLPGLI family protein [Flavobacterium okayamense]|uniref:GLPGLI family protein n=1 Tax=Flavobacterium okayamense TaxID=2830782 RepID=A0ABM7S810_9FLAO|nr:GLPGLI family protein [Flavobacterium okayamense]BCY27475.1 GLPGLI family protein [Flavobacterium okayamense]
MKKIVFAFAILTGILSNAQDFQGIAVYESKTSTADFMKGMSQNRDLTPEMQKNIEARMQKAFEKTFILNFNRTSSIYKEEEKLEAPGQGGGRMMMSMMGGGGTHFKNVKEQNYTVDKEVFGKEFLIKDSLPKYDWKLEGESRMIGNYNCFKATAVVPIDESDFRNFRFRGNKDEDKNETKKDTTKTSTTNLMDQWEMPKEKIITAWYSPEIPINQGPENYWGLPGLILEVNDGKTTILCSKIVLNTKDKVDIKAPTKGKEVSQKEFDETVKKKMEEMREMWRSSGGNRGGRGGFGR